MSMNYSEPKSGCTAHPIIKTLGECCNCSLQDTRSAAANQQSPSTMHPHNYAHISLHKYMQNSSLILHPTAPATRKAMEQPLPSPQPHQASCDPKTAPPPLTQHIQLYSPFCCCLRSNLSSAGCNKSINRYCKLRPWAGELWANEK